MTTLNTTSYAILGLLSKRDWPSYDITQHYRNSALFSCWPRAESYLYKEQKKLAKEGFIRTTNDDIKERRTIYTITPQGRQHLHAWLTDSSTDGQFRYEYESLVKFLFSDVSDDPAQLEYINNITKDAINDAKEVMATFEKSSLKSDTLGEYNCLNIYVFRFLVDLIELRIHWAKNMQFRLDNRKECDSTPEEVKREFEKQLSRLNELIGC